MTTPTLEIGYVVVGIGAFLGILLIDFNNRRQKARRAAKEEALRQARIHQLAMLREAQGIVDASPRFHDWRKKS